MKHIFIIATILSSTMFSFGQGNVGINTITPHAKAALDITATDKGMMIPRITQLAKNTMFPLADASAKGMLAYQTDNVAGFYFYDGIAWNFLSNNNPAAVSPWTPNGNHIYNSNTANIGLQNNSSPLAPLAFANSLGNKLAIHAYTDSIQYGIGLQSPSGAGLPSGARLLLMPACLKAICEALCIEDIPCAILFV